MKILEEIPTRREYHIHFDANECPKELLNEIQSLGFCRDTFLTNEQILNNKVLCKTYDPKILTNRYAVDFIPLPLHFTYKVCYEGNRFEFEQRVSAQRVSQAKKSFDDAIRRLGKGTYSYAEIEDVRIWEISNENTFDGKVRLGFSNIHTKYLDERKKADLHLSFPFGTRPEIIEVFAQTGMYIVVTPTETSMSHQFPVAKQIILTAQGTVSHVKQLAFESWRYLNSCGSIPHGTKLMIETLTVFADEGGKLPPQVTLIS